MGNYEKFKSLLEYFVAHLEWVTNSNENGQGYEKYIKPLGKKPKAAGYGHLGWKIQDQIKNWEEYQGKTICITVYASNFQSRGCYLHWKGTAFNIVANWDEHKNITHLEIEISSNPRPKPTQYLLKNSISELGLFDNQSPNQHLINFFNKFYELTLTTMEKYAALLKETRNLIFTGAPGTGKTYLAKQIAAEIIGVKETDLANNEQFAFVQFHPSYDYTDFVEGLRPTRPDEKGNIGFELKSGIFKAFCEKAKQAQIMNAIRDAEANAFTIDNFVLYMDTLSGKANYKIAIEQLLGIKDRKSKKEKISIPKFQNLNEIAEVDENKLREIADFLEGIELEPNYYVSPIKLLKKFKKSLEEKPKSKNFVIVIDEINRGEISKIFGELFFSIDPSYRGAKGAVKTQFSNLHEDDSDDFYVPENVYIIGTMNDIDRSVESFDFAMRRRFTWQEITAKESAANMRLPEEIVKRMDNLNAAIDKIEGLNSSYHIGGAYFLDKEGNPNGDFDKIWNYRLASLLNEYLRGMPNAEDKLKDLKAAYDKQ